MGVAGDREFLEEVFPAELGDVWARREAVGRERPAADTPTIPSTSLGLVGLSLSGGGIRSASFSLGVLQALQARGVFPHVDYLSTVSGGGWIGACLSTLMRAPGEAFPFAATPDNPALHHLRDRVAALVPSGSYGGLGFATRMLRGSLMTVAILLTALFIPAWSLAWLVRGYLLLLNDLQDSAGFDLADARWTWFIRVTPFALGASVLCLLATPVLRTVLRGNDRRLTRLDALPAVCFAVTLLVFFGELHVWLTWRAFLLMASKHIEFDLWRLGAFLWRWLLSVLMPVAITAALAVPLLVALRPVLVRALPALRVAGMALVAAASLGAMYLMVLYLSVFTFASGVKLPDTVLGMPVHVWVVVLVGLIFFFFVDTNESSLHGLFRRQLAELFVVRPVAGRYQPERAVPLSGLSQPGSLAPYHLFNTALNMQGSDDPALRGRNCDFFIMSKRFVGGPRTGYCPTAVLETICPNVDLAAAMATSAAAAAPNMGTYTLRSAVILLAFLNLRLGYWLPNPGRLRAWHEALVRRAGGRASADVSAWGWWTWLPKGGCYLRELSSTLDAKGQHVYLSDGGHLENTGAYELLRRRCRYLIVCDAEEDPSLRFGGLAALIRYARLDLGVEIDLDLAELAPDAHGRSRRHTAVGRVRYPALGDRPEEVGQIVYLKSSTTSDEDPVIAHYRAENPLFPHESTANQAFGEAQFEAYRALGEHVADGLFGAGFDGDRSPDPVGAWFAALGARVTANPLHDARYPDLRDELEEVETLLRAPEAEGYFAELYPELARPEPPASVAPALLHQIAMRQIHLMVSVFTLLSFDDPRARHHPWNLAWIERFRRWSRSPSFRRVCSVEAKAQGAWFRQICRDTLEYDLDG